MSANAEANVNGEGASAEADGSGELSGNGELSRSTGSAGLVASDSDTSAAMLSSSRVLLGARHDLKLRSGKATASCQCLAVSLGGAQSQGMVWSAVPPAIDDATQLTLALSSEGQACQGEPKDSLGASYWGYRISGNDVIVLVEAARGGRPLTTGAVIPRPVGSGQVFVAPASKKLPYGRPVDGKGLCKIGNPGQVRTGAFTELELGANTPSAGPKNVRGSGTTDEMPTTIELPSN
jgi:hypothetical protein